MKRNQFVAAAAIPQRLEFGPVSLSSTNSLFVSNVSTSKESAEISAANADRFAGVYDRLISSRGWMECSEWPYERVALLCLSRLDGISTSNLRSIWNIYMYIYTLEHNSSFISVLSCPIAEAFGRCARATTTNSSSSGGLKKKARWTVK